VETQAWIGALVNMVSSVRDANTHTHQNFNTNGLPNSTTVPLQRDIAQEIATDGKSMFSVENKSASGEWAWDLAGTLTPINRARVSFAVQSIIMYEVQNSLTECNYTLPVWASPLKSRNYRGDITLSAQVLSAVTGEAFTLKDLEKIGLRNFTLMRVYYALLMEHFTPGSGQNMRQNFDQIANWNFSDKGTKTSSAFILPRGELETAKDYLYDALGWDKATGLPTREKLVELGLDFCITRLEAAGLIPAAT
jgi:aldehyde:ferredoxin oxidoreductase